VDFFNFRKRVFFGYFFFLVQFSVPKNNFLVYFNIFIRYYTYIIFILQLTYLFETVPQVSFYVKYNKAVNLIVPEVPACGASL
jgi:hypothetical protein